ncbi:hypothetical protein CP09DC78_0269B, partial [Chlamydia psittaci 09DC78]
NSMFSDV